MSEFLFSENIRRYRALLAENLDPARRHTIESLLAEEEARAAAARLKQRHSQPRRPPRD
jgi:hypothetical protein